jgi:hypothetical protein
MKNVTFEPIDPPWQAIKQWSPPMTMSPASSGKTPTTATNPPGSSEKSRPEMIASSTASRLNPAEPNSPHQLSKNCCQKKSWRSWRETYEQER